MADRGKFEQLEEYIESTIDHCREAGIIVCDYQPGVAFHKKINDLVYKLQDVDRMQQDMQDVHVPIEVFSKIDAGENPQIYTRECMERAIARNEAVRGKLESLRRFRALLMAELSKKFPNEMAKYRSVRGDPEAPTFPSSANNSVENMQNTGSGSDTGHDSIPPR
ncbi:hypothetical protein AAHC03_012862 [Spirometra sp. Aus1]|nr:unnamed protein product [Spirometra erinaceieuropaei]